MQRRLINITARSVVRRSNLTQISALRPYALPVQRHVSFGGLRFASTEAGKETHSGDSQSSADETGSGVDSEKNENTEDGATEVPMTEVEELQSKLTAKDKEVAEMKMHYSRAIADFRSLQESTKKEVQRAKDFALQKFAKDLLESLDNFGLALNSIKPETKESNEEVKNLTEGFEMAQNVFEKTLGKHGIERIDPMGDEFDPNRHEATFELAQPEKKAGTVFFVQQLGYTLNGRVLRPAKVGVVKEEES